MGMVIRFTTTTPAAVAKIRLRAPIAQVRALNRAIASAKVAMVSVVSKDMGLKAALVSEKMTIKQARELIPVAILSASQKKIELIEFRATGPDPSRGKGRGVSVYLQGARVRYPKYFISRGRKSGKRHVFERVEQGRQRGPLPQRSQLPVRIKYGPSIYLVARFHRQVGIDRGREQLIKNLKSEFKWALAVDSST